MRIGPLLPLLVMAACAPADTKLLDPTDVLIPNAYVFESRFEAGADSVGYGARVVHHVRVQDLAEAIRLLTIRVDERTPNPGEIRSGLVAAFTAAAGSTTHDTINLTTEPQTLQTSYVMMSASAESLEDAAGPTAAAVSYAWFDRLEANAAAHTGGGRPSPVDPIADLPVHVTDDGVDVAAFLAVYLDGAVQFRGAMTNLTDGFEDADNTTPERDGRLFTALEHRWDQAFGAFGASRSYGAFTPRSLARGAQFGDHSKDQRIDLLSEYNFGAAVRVAERDADADGPFMAPAWQHFRRGRALITAAGGPLGADFAAALEQTRDDTVAVWEREVAASTIHSINEVLGVVCVCGDTNFVYGHSAFLEHATAWASLSARVEVLAMNPASRLADSDLAMLRTEIRAAPLHPATGVEAENLAYQADLVRARQRIADVYGFDTAQIGDEGGDGGW